ncbi:MAG: hypothetical protein IIA92_13755 [Chloroflexi bacterium]|nr:hypothetical protein [Chloroflexota bacterium]
MAINPLFVVGGVYLLSKLGRSTAEADAGTVEADFPSGVGAFPDPVFVVDPEESAFFFESNLDFPDFAGPSLGDLVPAEESLETPEAIAEADRAAVELQAEAEAEERQQTAEEAAALPRQRQFYIDDLVNRLGVPAAFFGGTIQGTTVEEVLLNYNLIYESYLQELDRLAGIQAEANMLAALQADLVAQLRAAGIAGTPVGGTEDELRASAQALIDQHFAAVLEQRRLAEAAALADQEAAAREQARLAEARLAEAAPGPSLGELIPAEESFDVITIEPVPGPSLGELIPAEESFFEPAPSPATVEVFEPAPFLFEPEPAPVPGPSLGELIPAEESFDVITIEPVPALTDSFDFSLSFFDAAFIAE